jgi:hypothetical protein
LAITIDYEALEANKRVTAIRLTMVTLRCMDNWRQKVGDYDSAMILVAVVAITAERLTRAELPAELRDLTVAVPPDELAPCNISSIAAATGINRETARRKVNSLVQAGYLVRSDRGVISFTPGYLQRPHIREVVRSQMEAIVRFVNDLCRDGTLTCDARHKATSA